jgi:Obg family GTPase CgtA-like protein
VQALNWDYYESGQRFQRILEACGVNDALREAGAKQGDAVIVGDKEFEFSDEKSPNWVQDYTEGYYGRGMSKYMH